MRAPLRKSLAFLLSLSAYVCSAGCDGAEPGPLAAFEAPADAPNVLLLSIDTLRADHLGLYGYERPTSPRLDAFARGAVVFDAAQASASWTLPGLASVLTSELTSTHHCWSFGSRLDQSFTTLTELLLAAGYDTACVTSHVFTTTRHGLQQGFVHFDDSYAYPAVDPEDNVSSNVISDRGIAFLEAKAAAQADAPWFLWLHYFDPHERYVEHEGISEEFVTEVDGRARTNDEIRLDLYDGEIRFTDQHVGRVLDVLESLGFADDTLVILLSDHGEEFLDHGARGHGHALFGELVRVPLVIRAPGLAPRRVTDVVRTIDLMPTVLELTGLPPFEGAAGRSVLPLMRGAAQADAPALAEIAPHGAAPQDCLVDGNYKLIRELGDPNRFLLYDLARDPNEQVDLSKEQPELVRKLAQRLTSAKSEALERAKRYDSARELELTPGLLDTLRDLGYVGEDE